MIETSIELLYAVTVALKGPVVVGILLALGWSLFETGAFLHEMIERRRHGAPWRSEAVAFRTVKKEKPVTDLLSSENAPDIAKAVMERHARTKDRLTDPDGLLEDVEFEAAKRLTRLRIGLRIGPVIGLMGTLIPMGPALMSISKGDLAVMSQDLVIAFSTTVAGLLVGALCYVMVSVRQVWYARDLADIERLFHGSGEGGR